MFSSEQEYRMFIISISYKVDLSEVEKHINEHIAYLDKYYAKGNFIASGPKVPRVGGVILAHANNKEELNVILHEDPFYKAGIANYDVTEFMPNKMVKLFESLIKLP